MKANLDKFKNRGKAQASVLKKFRLRNLTAEGHIRPQSAFRNLLKQNILIDDFFKAKFSMLAAQAQIPEESELEEDDDIELG